MKRILVLLFSVLVVFGCAQKNSALLELKYSGLPGEKKYPIKIALIEPQYTGTDVTQQIMSNPLMRLSIAQSTVAYDMELSSYYYTEYAPRIKTALLGDLERMIKDKGMIVVEKYRSFDEIPYGMKKDSLDLVLVPRFDFAPIVRNTPTTLPVIGTTNKGEIQLVGRLEVDLVEPLSKEKMIIKKVDVATATRNYNNNAEGYDALTLLLNMTYPDILGKLFIILDADEISETTANIQYLKTK